MDVIAQEFSNLADLAIYDVAEREGVPPFEIIGRLKGCDHDTYTAVVAYSFIKHLFPSGFGAKDDDVDLQSTPAQLALWLTGVFGMKNKGAVGAFVRHLAESAESCWVPESRSDEVLTEALRLHCPNG